HDDSGMLPKEVEKPLFLGHQCLKPAQHRVSPPRCRSRFPGMLVVRSGSVRGQAMTCGPRGGAVLRAPQSFATWKAGEARSKYAQYRQKVRQKGCRQALLHAGAHCASCKPVATWSAA